LVVAGYLDSLGLTSTEPRFIAKLTMLTSNRIRVALIAVCWLLINAYLNYRIAFGPILEFSLVMLFFFSRHLLCLVAAYPVAKFGDIGGTAFALLFVVPSLLLFHGFFIWSANGMLELWPPILFLDVALFSPALILLSRTRKSLSTLLASPQHEA
jgi:hypothetical protein